MRIAVTGAHGFIGRAVVNHIIETGHEPVALDLENGADVTQPSIALHLAGCDAVIHLAGVLGTAELYDAPDRAIDVNVRGTLRVLEVCRDQGLAYVGITMPNVWANLYQATKRAAQTIALAFCRDFEVPVTHVRAFNVYGPGQHVGAPQKIIPTFADCAYHDRPLPVWGDGQQTVDLVHVDHVARMLVESAVGSVQGSCGRGECWDAGSGHELAVLDVARLVCAAAGSRLVVEFLPMRPGELPGTRLCATDPGPFGFDRPSREDWHRRFAEVVRTYRPALVAVA